MSNALGTSPSVMVNRIALREGASLNTQLAKVAELRAAMVTAQAQAAQASPETAPPAITANGAEVDLLV